MRLIETIEKIETLEELIEILQQTPDTELGDLPFSPTSLAVDLEEFAFWRENDYTRICLFSDERMELILLCWSPGATTPVHCHAGSECWMHLCSGDLTESAYQLRGQNVHHLGTRSLASGDRAHINDALGLHMLANTSRQRSMSLHLYAPRVEACQRFDLLTHKKEWVTLKYDKVLTAV